MKSDTKKKRYSIQATYHVDRTLADALGKSEPNHQLRHQSDIILSKISIVMRVTWYVPVLPQEESTQAAQLEPWPDDESAT